MCLTFLRMQEGSSRPQMQLAVSNQRRARLIPGAIRCLNRRVLVEPLRMRHEPGAGLLILQSSLEGSRVGC